MDKLYYINESRLFRNTCPALYSEVDELWFISSDEHREFLGNSPQRGVSSCWLPAAIDPSCKPLTGQNARVLFAANLFQPTNLEALEWYLDEVHTRLAGEPDYEFWVAGMRRPGMGDAIIERLSETVSTRLFPSPESMDEIYQSCAVFVNPMRQGGGVKMKTLDAIRSGLPVVSTQVGIAGTGLHAGRDVLVGDDGEEMAESIRSLLHSQERRQQLHNSASTFVQENYNHKRNLERVLATSNRMARSISA